MIRIDMSEYMEKHAVMHMRLQAIQRRGRASEEKTLQCYITR